MIRNIHIKISGYYIPNTRTEIGKIDGASMYS